MGDNLDFSEHASDIAQAISMFYNLLQILRTSYQCCVYILCGFR